MKKTSILILLAIFAFGQTAWAQWSGDGSYELPYQISTSSDWNTLADNVNNGNTYSDQFFKLMNDITVTTMVGKTDRYFSGTFDGNGKTLTFNYTSTESYTAPFCFVVDATIRNLCVDGTITVSQTHAAGLISKSTGSSTIENCRVRSTINSSLNGTGTHGGFIALVYGEHTTRIEGCAFNGKLLGSNTNGWAGFVGRKNDEAELIITNSIYDPSQIDIKSGNNATFVRNGTIGDNTRCYYRWTLGEAQGKKARSITGGTDVVLAFSSDVDKIYNTSQITVYSERLGLFFGNTLYAGSNEFVELVVNYTGSQTSTQEHYGPKFSANNYSYYIQEWERAYMVLDDSENDIVINFTGFALSFEGYGSEEVPYEIYCTEQWNLLAYYVNNGISLYFGSYYRLMEDITVEENFSDFPETQVGRVDDEHLTETGSKSFSGVFDGDGHTITINYYDNSHKNNSAPFRYIESATIKNLHVTGNITKKHEKHAAGIVGQASGVNHIINCRSSVNVFVNYTDAWSAGDCSSGGVVGDIRKSVYSGVDAVTYLTGCVFDGTLVGGTEYESNDWGGFVGHVNGAADVYLEDCLFVPVRVDSRIGQYSDDGSRTFARGDGDKYYTNCYYTMHINGDQGKQAYSITASDYVFVANAGEATEYDVSLLTIFGLDKGIQYDSVLYAANGETVSLNLSCEPSVEYIPDSYIISGGTLSGTENPYTLTMPNENVIIRLETAGWTGTGTEDDPYLIYNEDQWMMLADKVNNPGANEEAQEGYNGKHFKLMNDITFGSIFQNAPSSVMVGNSEHSFRGIFDGDGHSFSAYLKIQNDYCAPFRFIDGATIKNLIIGGSTILTRPSNDYDSQKKYAGVVGRATGDCHITNCRASLNVGVYFKRGSLDSAYPSNVGGFIGQVLNGTVDIDNCVFDGWMSSDRDIGICWGGFIGFVEGNNGAHANITNCLFAPEYIILVNRAGSKTFARSYNDSDVILTNCYYTQTLGEAQGKRVHSITLNGEDIAMTLAGAANENGVSGITSYADSQGLFYCDSIRCSLIASLDDTVGLKFTTPIGYIIGAATYTPEGGEATEITPVGDVYPFLMPDADVTINVELVPGVIQTTELFGGLNWWSTNLDITLDQLKDEIATALGADGLATIKSQNGSITYTNGEWRPAEMDFDIREMYQIQVSTGCEITLTGLPVNPADYVITIHAGINWIGFLSGESISIDEALSGLYPEEGDVVKSSSGTSTYNGNGIWRGTIDNLEPGRGYIYHSKATEDKTFTFPNSQK